MGDFFMQRNSGSLQVQINDESIGMPVPNAKVLIQDESNKTIEELITDESGQTPIINLAAPEIDYSLDQNNTEVRPYSIYNIQAIIKGYKTKIINGTQILSNTLAIQEINLEQDLDNNNQDDNIFISANTLWGEFDPKIPEDPVKPLNNPTGEVVLNKVVIPEYIVVHDGVPNDSSAKNYYILFKDYIKNVACSEIYSTWPDATIRANVLAIISFALNRVYTEWYRNKGYNFTITSSTAYDHAFVYGRNFYKSISIVVDEMFNTYITKFGIRQPLLTQYCDGKKVSCPNWLSQWGSKYLGDQGYNAINILRRYYGQDIYLEQAQKVSGVPASFPGVVLQVGSRGENVRTIQNQLLAISKNYPAIPKLKADGIFGNQTRQAVQIFQQVFYLPATGLVDFKTWYKISNIYVAVQKLAELV
jgi:peptidoglycan hydrolase-like protein with peptidoglycan-binding domain